MKTQTKKQIISVGQGGYAIANKKENVILETYDLYLCVGAVFVSNDQAVLIHVDFYTNTDAILEVLEQLESPPEKYYVLLPPPCVDENDIKKIKNNLQTIINAAKHYNIQKNVIDKIQGNLDKGDTYKFAYDLTSDKFINPSREGLLVKFVHKKTLKDKMQDDFYCSASLAYIYRATCGKEYPKLIDFRNFALPLNSTELKTMYAYIPNYMQLYPLGAVYSLDYIQQEFQIFFRAVEQRFIMQAHQFLQEICKREGKFPDAASLKSAVETLFMWSLKTAWGPRLFKLTDDEARELNTLFEEPFKKAITKNNATEQISQIFKFSNLFFKCSTYHIDIKKLSELLPNPQIVTQAQTTRKIELRK